MRRCARVEAHEARIAAGLGPGEHAELLRLLLRLLGWDLARPGADGAR